MSEIKRIYCQSLPALKFVGRCYGEADKQNGTFSHIWGEWFGGNMFEPLCIESTGKEPFEDCNAYYGLSRCKEGEPFEYWIGVFLPLDAAVPDGYQSIDFNAGEIAVCWVYGKEPDIYFHCCLEALKQKNLEWVADKEGVKWCFERYVSPRFTEPDADGNVILDMCFYIKHRNNHLQA